MNGRRLDSACHVYLTTSGNPHDRSLDHTLQSLRGASPNVDSKAIPGADDGIWSDRHVHRQFIDVPVPFGGKRLRRNVPVAAANAP